MNKFNNNKEIPGFEHTWRWFGPHDPVSLKEIRQTGATGIVTALHHIPVGEIWSVEEIEKRKEIIESEDLVWSVVESLPVHENIKKQKYGFEQIIEKYKTSLRNLAASGIKTVCYNFMPVLDWSRTDLEHVNKDGSISSKFDVIAFSAFDLFILQREGAEKEYSKENINLAKKYYDSLTKIDKKKLHDTILLGLPGSLETYTLEEFKSALAEYKDIDENTLRNNLIHFIKEIIPVAEEVGILMAIHPDDPPRSLLGLPRVVGNKNDIRAILTAYNSLSNGLTFCSGSLGAGIKNNLVDIAKSFADKIHFVHLRNLTRNKFGDFRETTHLEGEVDIFKIIKTLIQEQKRRSKVGRIDSQIPIRPDHGNLMIPDMDKEGIYPGYSLFGRMRGLAELRGMEKAIYASLHR